MRYTYISNPNDKAYVLVHRALVTLKDNMISLEYYKSGVKRKYPLTFTSTDGILLNVTKTMGPNNAYNMFIPETNPYFNYSVLYEAFTEANTKTNDDIDVIEKFVKLKMYAIFQKVWRESKKAF